MSQILHIFRKDTRRFRPEIALSLVALAIYVVSYPVRWNPGFPWMLQPDSRLTIYLVAAAWLLLIARLVHAESPVGENQFWLTRPYDWKKLLAAKALFVAAWIYVPFVIAQMLVLAEAGFSPLGSASGWLWMLSFYTGVLIVPLLAMAALTESFARTVLAVFGGYLAAVAFYVWIEDRSETATISRYVQGYGTMVPHSHSSVVLLIAIVGGGAVVVVQYATRRVWVSRSLAIGVAVVGAGVVLALAKMPQREVERQYPAESSGVASALQLAFAPSPSNPLWAGVHPNDVFIPLPIDLSGIPEGSAVEIDNMQFSMDAADGSHWTGPWRQLNSTPFLPGTHAPSLPFILRRKDYERFKNLPVTLHVTLALTELHAGAATTATIASPAFATKGFGVCSNQWHNKPQNFLLCRSEFGELPLTYITAAFSNAPCSGPQPQPAEVRTFAELAGKAYSDPIDSAVDPVRLTYIDSGAYDSQGHLHGTSGRALCPGTPVHFTRYDVVRRSRAYLTIPDFQLPLPQQPPRTVGWRPHA